MRWLWTTCGLLVLVGTINACSTDPAPAPPQLKGVLLHDAFSIDFWVEADPPSVDRTLVSWEGPNGGIRVGFEGGQIVFHRNVETDAVARGPEGPTPVRTHVVAVYDGTASTLWINGVAGASIASTGNLRAPRQLTNLRLETSPTTIDELAVFDRALSADEIASHTSHGR